MPFSSNGFVQTVRSATISKFTFKSTFVVQTLSQKTIIIGCVPEYQKSRGNKNGRDGGVGVERCGKMGGIL